MAGIQAEVVVDSASACPVADVSTGVPGSVRDVTWSGGHGGTGTEQFAVEGSDSIEETDIPNQNGFEPVFEYGDRTVFEFQRDHEESCACELVEEIAGPLTDIFARDGRLHLSLIVEDVEALKDVIAQLRERYNSVSIEYLVRSETTEENATVVPVDLNRMTDRQREVLTTAKDMGYFEYPRDANAEAVSAALDIDPSTFAEHLAAAQSKLLDDLDDHV